MTQNGELEVRMYSMVLRQLNPMQKGIQSLHAVVDYSVMIFDPTNNVGDDVKCAYDRWAEVCKTMIVLDAGTSSDLDEVSDTLAKLGVEHCGFCEPDLYGIQTAVCFVADERVYDTERYPLYDPLMHGTMENFLADYFGGISTMQYDDIMALRELIFSKKLSM